MTNVLRLAVDARDLASDTRGIGRYARAILRRLLPREDIAITLLVYGPFPFRRRAALRAALGSDRFRLATRPGRRDVVWHPANGTFFSGGRASVVTIHDAVPFRFPHPDAKRRAHQQAPFLRSVRAAARVIAVSQFDRDELREVFALPGERIDVVHHGVDAGFSPGPPDASLPAVLQRPYLLFVGDPAAEPRKNFALLLDAYRSAFRNAADPPPLAVVGPADPKIQGVTYAGHAGGDASGEGDGRLAALYRGALALCMASYYETFGMPLAEAMACGTPVIASRASCLPEIGGDAPLYAPPHDAQAWAQALRDVASSPALRERMRGEGLEVAKRYDWDRSAARHAEIFRSL